MKTRKELLLIGLSILFAFALTNCGKNNNPDIGRKAIYRVDIDTSGDEGTISLLSFHILKGDQIDNSTYIRDNIKGENTQLTSITTARLPVGKSSYETMDGVENIMITVGVGNTGETPSIVKVTVYKNNQEIYTKTMSSQDSITQLTFNSKR